MTEPLLLDTRYNFHEGDSEHRKLVIERTQEIPTSFIDELREERFAADNAPVGNFMRVASVPTVVVEKWLREGFDIYKESAKAIVARLRNEDLSAFLATSRRI